MRRKTIFWIFFPWLSCVLIFGSTASESSEEIKVVLEAQVEAWNEGNLDRFMETYWNSQNLTFFSGGHSLSGWQATLLRYRQRYRKEGQDMGRLHFSDLKVLRLSEDSGFVRGRFHLVRSGMEDLTGLFTLVLRKFPGGWKIIHDHTSTGN